MNWLERARREIPKSAGRPTAVTAGRIPTAVTAAQQPTDSSGSSANADAESATEWWCERAAIMEFDGGLSRDEAEQAAWARTLARLGLPSDYRLH